MGKKSEKRFFGSYAGVYDYLNDGAAYEEYAVFIDGVLQKRGLRGCSMLDLACGTGSLTKILSDMNYHMSGLDISQEMLTEAAAKTDGKVFLTEQDMRDFQLFSRVGAVICTYDTLNYLMTDGEIEAVFARVFENLEDGGVFIFDVNTLYRFKTVYADNTFALDYNGLFCSWENSYNEKRRVCSFHLTFFTENDDGTYSRFDDTQKQKYIKPETIRRLLKKTGFEMISEMSEGEALMKARFPEPEKIIFTAYKNGAAQKTITNKII